MEKNLYTQKSPLRQMRELRGWTQKDVADKLGLPDTRTLRRWESGDAIPSLRYRAKLCDIFERSPIELGLSAAYAFPPLETETDEAPLRQGASSEHVFPTAPSTPSFLLPLTTISTSPDHWNRQRLLEKVYTIWIKGILEQSLQGNAYLTLDLREQPAAVANPWSGLLEVSQPALPLTAPALQVYDDACGELLILGEPGAGKTTLLLELARDLLLRAVENDYHPIPVIFNLSSWSMSRQPLAAWLVEELSSKYQVPQSVGHAWVVHDHILPLLDGLDELSPAFRKPCVDAINAYRQTHGLLPMVACSRREEYLNLATPLLLQKAVCIQPLTAQHIEAYVNQDDEHLEALWQAFREDVELQQMLTTPLMLNVLTSAYRCQSAETLKASGSVEMRRRQVFALYVESMLKRRKPARGYSLQQSIHWLAYLARQMKCRDQTAFYLEHMQFDWLPCKRLQQLCYGGFIGVWAGLLSGVQVGLIARSLGNKVIEALLIIPCIALVVGLIAGIAGALLEPVLSHPIKKGLGGVLAIILAGGGLAWLAHSQFWPGSNSAPQYEAIVGLVVMLVLLLPTITGKHIQPTEVVHWSWMRVRKLAFSSSSLLILFICIGIEIIGGFLGGLDPDMGLGIIVILLFALLSLFNAGLLSGFSSEMLERRQMVKPNQGIHRSAYHALRHGLVATGLNMIALVLAGIFIQRFFPGLIVTTNFLMWSELAFSLTLGLVVGIQKGGGACLKHCFLRLILCIGRHIPWNYTRFLEYAVEHILLYKIGGGYIFIHRFLLDYFASLTEGE